MERESEREREIYIEREREKERKREEGREWNHAIIRLITCFGRVLSTMAGVEQLMKPLI